MKMLLYRPGMGPSEVNVEPSVESIAPFVGTDQYEWMTVRMLGFCVIHNPEGKATGGPLNRMLGKTPLFGDFLVCGIAWDDEGNTRATPVSVRLRKLLVETIFNKFPQSDDVEDNLPSYARKQKGAEDTKQA